MSDQNLVKELSFISVNNSLTTPSLPVPWLLALSWFCVPLDHQSVSSKSVHESPDTLSRFAKWWMFHIRTAVAQRIAESRYQKREGKRELRGEVSLTGQSTRRRLLTGIPRRLLQLAEKACLRDALKTRDTWRRATDVRRGLPKRVAPRGYFHDSDVTNYSHPDGVVMGGI